jgi:hypothetical protein
MSLEMRQRLVMGTKEDLADPVTNTERDKDCIFRYVRRVTLEEERTLPVSKLKAIIPPYPPEMMANVKNGNVIRWETGYWEDGITALVEENDGYHLEFEGIITAISQPNSYIGGDAEKLMRRGEYKDLLSIEIEADDYMNRINSAELEIHDYRGTIAGLVELVLAANNNRVDYGLSFVVELGSEDVNPSDLHIALDNRRAAKFLYMLRTTSVADIPNATKQVGIDTYFHGRKLKIKDPNDLNYSVKQPIFAEGQNVIQSNLTPRAAKHIQVIARWYNPRTGDYTVGPPYPAQGSLPYRRASILFTGDETGKPVIQTYDVEGDESNLPTLDSLYKTAERIYTSIAGDGLVGKFLTFGYPHTHRGDIIVFIGRDLEMQKAVVVDKVVKTYDAENAKFRQEIIPGFTPSKIINPVVGDNRVSTQDDIADRQKEYNDKIVSVVEQIREKIKAGGTQ